MNKYMHLAMAIVLSLGLVGCDKLVSLQDRTDQPVVLKKTTFKEVPNWDRDNHADALKTFLVSCDAIEKKSPEAPFGPKGLYGTHADWQAACKAGRSVQPDKPFAAKAYFEEWFSPYVSFAGFFKTGLFTGYYEAELNGSLKKHRDYQTPIYARPDDVIDVNLGAFRDDLSGRRIAGRIKNNRLVPYETRAEINNKGTKAGTPILAYVDSPIDAFFLHIQGSGRINLDTGSVLRVGYAGQNGWPYYAIGRELVKMGQLEKDQVSLQSIRNWMIAYPEKAQELRETNPSFIFFRKLDGKKPIGGQGVELTPKRSLAIDTKFWGYGMPIWLQAQHPIYTEKDFYQLMIAQDTGGAIRGPIRGDVFWGHGRDAELLAGPMKSEGRMWALLPKSIGKDYFSSARPIEFDDL